MSFTKTVSTVILISSIATIFLFALIFWLYTNADSQSLTSLKEALSTTSGFFGGIATLIAAYIASKLFNDWKKQTKYELKKEIITDIHAQLREKYSIIHYFNNELIRRHQDPDLFNIDPINEKELPSFDILKLTSDLQFMFDEYSILHNDDKFIILYNNFLQLLKSYSYHLSLLVDKNNMVNLNYFDEWVNCYRYGSIQDINNNKLTHFAIQPTHLIGDMFLIYKELIKKISELLDPENH
jgi:hypothetical protein